MRAYDSLRVGKNFPSTRLRKKGRRRVFVKETGPPAGAGERRKISSKANYSAFALEKRAGQKGRKAQKKGFFVASGSIRALPPLQMGLSSYQAYFITASSVASLTLKGFVVGKS